jgi:hypothetical protein
MQPDRAAKRTDSNNATDMSKHDFEARSRATQQIDSRRVRHPDLDDDDPEDDRAHLDAGKKAVRLYGSPVATIGIGLVLHPVNRNLNQR